MLILNYMYMYVYGCLQKPVEGVGSLRTVLNSCELPSVDADN